MTISKINIILKNITDAYNNIDEYFNSREAFERKVTLLNLATSIKLYLKEACIKREYSNIELYGIEKQLKWLSFIRNKGLMTQDYINLEASLLKRKEDILISLQDWEATTRIDIPEELMTQITSWYSN